MLRTYKYQIHPTEDQKILLASIFGSVRFAYNIALETKKIVYSGYQKNVTRFELQSQLKELKNNECQWLKDVPSQALQSAILNLDNAYNNFYKTKKGFPKFKNKYSKQSFQLPQGVKISDDNKQIFIPKLKWIDIHLSRPFKGQMKTVTVSKTVTDKYYVSILVDTKQELPIKQPINIKTVIGVDLGIKDFAMTSDGKRFENQGFLKSELKRLRIEQRLLSRKKKGSKKYYKQKIVVALLYERIRNKRQDYLHKVSRWLVDSYDTICIEDLATSNMLKNHKLAKAISDMGWSEFRRMLTYKCEWYGKNLVVIGRFEPSSKMCSCCETIKEDLTLADREWTCSDCGVSHDRDVNAAVNIRNIGFRKLKIKTGEDASEVSAKVDSGHALLMK